MIAPCNYISQDGNDVASFASAVQSDSYVASLAIYLELMKSSFCFNFFFFFLF